MTRGTASTISLHRNSKFPTWKCETYNNNDINNDYDNHNIIILFVPRAERTEYRLHHRKYNDKSLFLSG